MPKKNAAYQDPHLTWGEVKKLTAELRKILAQHHATVSLGIGFGNDDLRTLRLSAADRNCYITIRKDGKVIEVFPSNISYLLSDATKRRKRTLAACRSVGYEIFITADTDSKSEEQPEVVMQRFFEGEPLTAQTLWKVIRGILQVAPVVESEEYLSEHDLV